MFIQPFLAQKLKKNAFKLKWNEIAEVISNKLPGSNRTGKQCRERWFNQLDPSIKHN